VAGNVKEALPLRAPMGPLDDSPVSKAIHINLSHFVPETNQITYTGTLEANSKVELQS
jgi:hypothetical protein